MLFFCHGLVYVFFSDANLDVNVSMTKDSSLHFNVTAFVTACIRMSTSMAQEQQIVKCNPIRVDPEFPAGPNANIGFSSGLPFASIYTLIALAARKGWQN